MDDYSVTSLSESKNEWCARLVNTITPEIIQGLKSIFNEAWKLCEDNDELDKYLMTFQTFLSRVPKWNSEIIETERKRICESSGCGYLEELITCVHVIQLKALSCVRVGQKQKKVDIDVPSVDAFIHKIYINVARKIYTNIYLFEKNIAPLQIQKHNRELELIIRECIMNSVRESIPVEAILRAYMDETEEQHVDVKEVQEKIAIVPEPPKATPIAPAPAPAPVQIVEQAPTQAPAHIDTPTHTKLTFSDTDRAIDIKGIESTIEAPKTIERLETISAQSFEKQRHLEDDDDNNNDKLRIGGDIKLDFSDISDINSRPMTVRPPPMLDVEILPTTF
jgi:hypothetical protein